MGSRGVCVCVWSKSVAIELDRSFRSPPWAWRMLEARVFEFETNNKHCSSLISGTNRLKVQAFFGFRLFFSFESG